MSVLLRWHGALPVVFAALLSLVFAGTVVAQGPAGTTLEFLPPGDGAVGRELMVAARLTDRSGVPVQGAEVLFLREAKFMNALSELELGRALTDAQGMATLSFVPLSEGDLLVIAEFLGDGQFGPSLNDVTVFIGTGPAQYTEEAGVRIPGINVSLLVGILGGVWATYFVVMTLVWRIAYEGAAPSSVVEVSRE